MINLSSLLLTRKKLLIAVVLWLLALASLFFPVTGMAAGQDSNAQLLQTTQREYNVKMTARSLFEGAYKYGDWLPIEITLENFGASTNVQVEAVVNNINNNNTYPNIFRRPVTLGEKAVKKFQLFIQPYVSNNNVSRFVSSEQQVVLKTANGERKIAEQNVRLLPISPKDYLVAVISNDPNLVVPLNNLKVGKLGARVGVTSITSADFPDRAEGWRSFSSLVLSEVSSSNLTTEQQTALLDWVSGGGQLILMGGNGWGKVSSGFDRSLMPISVYDYIKISNLDDLLAGEKVKTPLIQPVTMALGEVVKGARPVVISTINTDPTKAIIAPLMAERRLGSGRILSVAVDLTTLPLAEWTGGTKVWQDIFGFNSGIFYQIYEEQNPQLKNNSDFFTYIASVPEVPLPNIWPFFAMFGIYLLVVGPVNYLILMKAKKLVWAWFSLPISGAICIGVALWISANQPPGEVLVSQMSVIQVSPEQENAQVRSYVAVFSPQERQYEVAPTVVDNVISPLVVPLNRSYSSNLVELDNSRLVVNGDQPRIESFKVNQWSAQGFTMESSLPARNYQLDSNLYFVDRNGESKINGTITNRTNLPIRSIMLSLGEQVQKVKDLLPGETLTVDFSLPSPTQLSVSFCALGFGNYNSYVSNTVGEKLQNVLQADKSGDRLAQNRGNFLRKIYEIGRYSITNQQRGFDLVGWIDGNPLPVSVKGVNTLPNSNQVLMSRLPVSGNNPTIAGQYYMPASYLYPENSFSDQGYAVPSSRLERSDQVCLSRGTVTSTYRLPFEEGSLRLNKMTLYINSITANTSRAAQLPDKVELYDWQQNNWVSLNSLNNSANQQSSTNNNTTINSKPVPNEIDNPTRFANSQTGQVSLRFTAPSPALLVQFGLQVEGLRN